jgi:hypothetical protein
MKYKTVPDKINKESLVKRIHSLLDEIQTEAEPHLLNQYRSIFRKEVSFFRRSYLAAYLLLLAEKGKTFGKWRDGRRVEENRGNFCEDNSGKNGEQREDFRSRDEMHCLPEGESSRLFVGVGRNRKVFPREIIGLLNTKARITKDDIGDIRILDNYSFVQVRTTVADTVIKALNGQNFRGRTLTVNYARTKKDDPETLEYGNPGAEFSENG